MMWDLSASVKGLSGPRPDRSRQGRARGNRKMEFKCGSNENNCN